MNVLVLSKRARLYPKAKALGFSLGTFGKKNWHRMSFQNASGAGYVVGFIVLFVILLFFFKRDVQYPPMFSSTIESIVSDGERTDLIRHF